MNEQQLAAVKQALGALKKGTGWMEHGEIITALQSIISQDALEKIAEESRTSGLRLDDWDKIGCVNHDCDKCKAVQEPVSGVVMRDGCPTLIQDKHIKENDQRLYSAPPAPQPVPVKTYHDGKPWPVAPKPWVGLTDEDIEQGWKESWVDKQAFESAVWWAEKKLKEKNL